MKARTGSSVVMLVMLAACGGGGSDSPGVQVINPPAPVPAPTPTPAPGGNTPAPINIVIGIPTQPPASGPPPAPPLDPEETPAAPPPATEPPPPAAGQPAPAEPAPPPAAGQPAPAEPAPPPAPAVPTIVGGQFAKMVNYNDAPFRGPPVGFGASGDAAGSNTGRIYSFQSTSPGTYLYSSATLSAGNHPYYSYAGVTMSLPFSFHDGEVGLGQVMTVRYPSYPNQSQEPPQMQLTRQEGPFVIRTTDRFALNTTIAQWTSPNPSGLENYVQLQTGTYNGMIRNCWHFFLPNLVRQACYLWDSNEALRHLGYYIVDDSGSGLGKSIRKFELLFSSLSPPAPAPVPDNPAPTIRTQPSIASNGSTQVGTVLTRVPGAYGGTGNDYSGQWSRTRGGVTTDIPGAQQANYTLQPADVGYTVTFNEIVVNASGRVVGSSAAYGPVTATSAPMVRTEPQITANGSARVGTTLLRVEGVYTNGARGVRGLWYRVDSSSNVTDTGEGRATYTLKPADVGHFIMFQEIAANAAGQEVLGHSGLYGPVGP